jgi:hypothetical protein
MLKHMTYQKDNGDTSERDIIVVSEPRKNYLVYDVSKLSDDQLEVLVNALDQIEEFRNNAMKDFELITGVKQSSLWRSFKPEGIDWTTGYDKV